MENDITIPFGIQVPEPSDLAPYLGKGIDLPTFGGRMSVQNADEGRLDAWLSKHEREVFEALISYRYLIDIDNTVCGPRFSGAMSATGTIADRPRGKPRSSWRCRARRRSRKPENRLRPASFDEAGRIRVVHGPAASKRIL